MGADYSAVSIIGIGVLRSELVTEQTVKAFKHNQPKSRKFDSKTGKRLWVKEDKPIKGYNIERGRFGKYKVYGDDDDTQLIIAVKIHDKTYSNNGPFGQYSQLSVTTLAKLKKELRLFLEPKGLWDEKLFGLYTVLSVSV